MAQDYLPHIANYTYVGFSQVIGDFEIHPLNASSGNAIINATLTLVPDKGEVAGQIAHIQMVTSLSLHSYDGEGDANLQQTVLPPRAVATEITSSWSVSTMANCLRLEEARDRYRYRFIICD